jgi:hypothetical protein
MNATQWRALIAYFVLVMVMAATTLRVRRSLLSPGGVERTFAPPARFNKYLAANWQQVPKNGPIWVPGDARRTPLKLERLC